ncbi:Programmed cell death protein 2 [Saguinus oedipus]|uniref:Programmed cell death protein 2 n=1 Tax=Saguinus oedipus TaxID=9490 RepID=A0ABQ9URD2_SAGOE|nr:Programmed cell death protein 2 [Saguinus oedipus]
MAVTLEIETGAGSDTVGVCTMWILFPEFDIVAETENEITHEIVEKEGDSEATGSVGEALEKGLDSMVKRESRTDTISQKFNTQLPLEPERILG